jgi:coenzyme F420 hydrogenase subunit beta
MSTTHLTIEDIVKAGRCHGCATCHAACAQAAIDMHIDENLGVYVPVKRLDRCTQCGLCDRVCPAIHEDVSQLATELYGDSPYTPMTGHYHAVYAGWTNDHSLRHASASGGLLTQVLLYLLAKNQIDAAVVTCANETDPLHPKGVLARSAEEILAAKGSKYCPVPLNSILKRLKTSKEVRRFAYVGLPCHIRGMRRYAETVPGIKDRLAYTFGIICGRTLTFKATDHLLETYQISPSEVKQLTYRSEGWPGHMLINNEMVAPLRDYYRRVNRACFLPSGCQHCTDAYAELADAAFGDAWLGQYTSVPNAGTSLIVTRHQATDELLQSMVREGCITLEPSSLRQLCYAQASVILSKKKRIVYPLIKALGPVGATLKIASYLIKSYLRR